jgi:DNA repair photolyase
MIVREICARSIISRSKIYEYTINTYGGCAHACSYCYARFMKRFSGHQEPWGQYVDVKINAPDLLQKEVKTRKPGNVWISGVCDPYQPIEKKYQLTRRCLAILIQNDWPITIQTRSPLVTRDLDLLKGYSKVEVGITVTTGDDRIRRIFEPCAPPIKERVRVDELHSAGVKTFAMIAPLLPQAVELVPLLAGKVQRVRIDRMNYRYADWVYKKYHFQDFLTSDYFSRASQEICSSLEKQEIECQVIF